MVPKLSETVCSFGMTWISAPELVWWSPALCDGVAPRIAAAATRARARGSLVMRLWCPEAFPRRE